MFATKELLALGVLDAGEPLIIGPGHLLLGKMDHGGKALNLAAHNFGLDTIWEDLKEKLLKVFIGKACSVLISHT